MLKICNCAAIFASPSENVRIYAAFNPAHLSGCGGQNRVYPQSSRAVEHHFNRAEQAECLEGEAAISGSFWTAPGLQKSLEVSDRLHGADRAEALRSIQAQAAAGSAYIPVWLVAPRAWSSTDLVPLEFDGSGHLRLAALQRAHQREELP